MSNNVLLVWELIPEQSKIYRLLDLDDETFAKILKCHGLVTNVHELEPDVDSTISWLCDWLKDQEEWLVSDLFGPEEYMSEWLEGFRLVHTGFAL